MKNTLILSLVTFSISTALSADVLVDYQFDAGSAAPTSTDVNVGGSSFDIGPAGSGASPAWIISGGTEMALAYANSAPASEADAVSNGSFFGFTITPDSGYQVDLTNLTFDTIANATQDLSGNTEVTFFVRSSVDNYGSTIDSFTQPYVNSFSFDDTFSRTVTLSDQAFQEVTEATTFRIYIWDTSGSNLRTPRIDNVQLNGASTAIPEVSSFSIPFLIGLVAYCVRSRRR